MPAQAMSMLNRNDGSVRCGGPRAFSGRGPHRWSRRVGGGVSLQPSRLLLEQLRRLDQVGAVKCLGPGWHVPVPIGLGLIGPDEMAARSLGCMSRWWGNRRALTGSAARRGEHVGETGKCSPAADACAATGPGASGGRLDPQKPCSAVLWWARQGLNLRPLPCQQTTGNRCATPRSPRSAPTVEAEGKRSLDVKGNALSRHLSAAAHRRQRPPRRDPVGPMLICRDHAANVKRWRDGQMVAALRRWDGVRPDSSSVASRATCTRPRCGPRSTPRSPLSHRARSMPPPDQHRAATELPRRSGHPPVRTTVLPGRARPYPSSAVDGHVRARLSVTWLVRSLSPA